MYAEIVSAIESAKTLRELLKAASSLSNYNELVAAVSEVNAKLMEATGVALSSQEKQSLLTQRIRELEDELMKLKNWEREAERYALYTLAPGVFAYALKPGMENGEPPHYLCANCMSKRQKSLLQVASDGDYTRKYICHNCSSGLSVQKAPQAKPSITISDDPFKRSGIW